MGLHVDYGMSAPGIRSGFEMTIKRVHGGADANGHIRWDFSTCANAAGPNPQVMKALRAVDPTRYPDFASTQVRHALASLHGVAAWRILPAASASEFIQRVTAVTARLLPGSVSVPLHAYGDYAAAACAWNRPLCPREAETSATLRWYAEPSSPLGRADAPPARPGSAPTVLDAVYEPLRLESTSSWARQERDAVFVLQSPNKALGLTGVRGAYAIAPAQADFDVRAFCQALEMAAPSWPLSAYAEAMLIEWATPAVQEWVSQSRQILASWKLEMQRQLESRGFDLYSSTTPFFVVRLPVTHDAAALRQLLKSRDIGIRDASSFGLPGCWRVCAQPPVAQYALMNALDAGLCRGTSL